MVHARDLIAVMKAKVDKGAFSEAEGFIYIVVA